MELILTEQQKYWAIKISAIVVVVVIGVFFIIIPGIKTKEALKTQYQESQTLLELAQSVNMLKNKTKEFDATLTASSDRTAIIKQISELASRNNFNIEQITPRTAKEGLYTKLVFDVKGTGSFFATRNFLRDTEKMSPSVFAKEISMQRNAEDFNSKKNESVIREEMLSVRLLGETYLKSSPAK